MNNPTILDTHVLLWLLLQPEEISEDKKKLINTSQENGELLISSISLWEIAMLKFKRRINIYEQIQDFLESITSAEGLSACEISPEVAAESVQLMDDFHGDPADRIIVATTKTYGATLLTRDKKILSWSKYGHIKALEV